MTMASRVLGFVRDIMIAAVLGTGPVADAFFVAFRFPNLFRRLFAEGAFNAAFVPLYAKRLEAEGENGARGFASEAASALLAALLILTAVAELAMPWLMYVIAPGFADTPDKFDLAVLLTRIAFPYLLFVSLVALLSGMLNAHRRFALAAAAPVFLNIVLIAVMAALIWASLGATPEAGVALSWGVSVAGVVQFAILAVWAERCGILASLRRPRLTPGVRRLVRLGVPGVIAGGITQINILIGTMIASLQDSAVSWLYYADRVYQLPLGIVGIAVGIVLLPDLSRKLSTGDDAGALTAQNRSLEFALLLTLPAAVALLVAATPIICVLFERGAFDAEDTRASALALAAFAVGLPAFVMIKALQPGFFAREDTKTPMIFAGVNVAVNVVGSLALFFVIGHVGIAAATSLGGWANAGLLAWTLKRRGQFALDYAFRHRIGPICLSSAIMGAALWAGVALLDPCNPAYGLALRAGSLAVLVLGGLVIYGVAAQLTHAADIPSLLRKATRG